MPYLPDELPTDPGVLGELVDGLPDRDDLNRLVLAAMSDSAPANYEVAQVALTRIYALVDLAEPTYHEIASPLEFFKTAPEALRRDYPEIWGQLDAMLAYNLRWSLLREPEKFTEAGVEFTHAMWDLVHASSVCYAYEGDCWISDRFAQAPGLELADDTFRYHATAGPAVRFRDGFEGYAIRGVPVPPEFFAPDLDPGVVIDHANAEVRRVGITELLGWPKVLDHISAEVIDTNADPCIGTLYHGTLNGERIAVVKVLCPSTDRVYGLGVPLTCTTAVEARAAGFPTAREFNPDEES